MSRKRRIGWYPLDPTTTLTSIIERCQIKEQTRQSLDSLKMILAMDLATFRQKKWQDLDLATLKKQNKIT